MQESEDSEVPSWIFDKENWFSYILSKPCLCLEHPTWLTGSSSSALRQSCSPVMHEVYQVKGEHVSTISFPYA